MATSDNNSFLARFEDDSLRGCVKSTVSWLASVRPSTVPSVERQARLLFIDTLGCMIAGLAKPEVRALVRGFAQTDQGPVHLPGASEAGLSVANAAIVSAVAACWDEACEGLARAHGRPGLHAFAATLPLALVQHRSLADTLDALTVGFEIGGRCGETFRIFPGMHVDGTWGTFGAVASAADLLGADIETTLDAVLGAACQLPNSLYLPVAHGKTVRNLYSGLAASRAIAHVSASLAGIDAPAGALDDLARLFKAPERWAPDGEWLIEQGYLKPYAAVRHVHYGANAAVAWREEQTHDDLTLDAESDAFPTSDPITRIVLETYVEAMTYCGNRAPTRPISAQFSLSYGAVHALVFGDVGPEAYDAPRLGDARLRKLEALVEISASETFAEQRGARLTISQTSGRTRTYEVTRVPGDLALPLSETDVFAKFTRYVHPIIGPETEGLLRTLAEAKTDSPLSELVGTT